MINFQENFLETVMWLGEYPSIAQCDVCWRINCSAVSVQCSAASAVQCSVVQCSTPSDLYLGQGGEGRGGEGREEEDTGVQ